MLVKPSQQQICSPRAGLECRGPAQAQRQKHPNTQCAHRSASYIADSSHRWTKCKGCSQLAGCLGLAIGSRNCLGSSVSRLRQISGGTVVCYTLQVMGQWYPRDEAGAYHRQMKDGVPDAWAEGMVSLIQLTMHERRMTAEERDPIKQYMFKYAMSQPPVPSVQACCNAIVTSACSTALRRTCQIVMDRGCDVHLCWLMKAKGLIDMSACKQQ